MGSTRIGSSGKKRGPVWRAASWPCCASVDSPVAMTRSTTVNKRGGLMDSPSCLVDVAEGPDDPEALPREGEVGAADDRRAHPHSESNAAAVVHVADIDVALERHDLAGVDECRHLEVAGGMPSMLDAHVGGVIVPEPIPSEAAEVIVAA